MYSNLVLYCTPCPSNPARVASLLFEIWRQNFTLKGSNQLFTDRTMRTVYTRRRILDESNNNYHFKEINAKTWDINESYGMDGFVKIRINVFEWE